MEPRTCTVHKLVADVCLLAEGNVLLVRYRDVSKYDGQTGWFLPDDYMVRMEHPEETAQRIVREQAGMPPTPLTLAHIESFEGHGYWHLIFHYQGELERPPAVELRGNVKQVEWFPLSALPEPTDVGHGGWALETIQKIFAHSQPS